ncbi:MAG: hypothetical protein Q7J45_03755 [bacterium]|nr:hypothetical protein [bacterium]
MMTRKNGFAPILILGIIAVALLLSSGGYIAYKKTGGRPFSVTEPVTRQQESGPISDKNVATSTQNSTTDWQTYRNEKYGFVLQYPPYYSLSIKEYPEESVANLEIKNKRSESLPGNSFYVYIWKDIYDKDYWDKRFSNKEISYRDGTEGSFEPLGTTTFAGTVGGITVACVMGGCSRTVTIPKNGFIFTVDLSSSDEDPTYIFGENNIARNEEAVKIRKQILSSFKFTR